MVNHVLIKSVFERLNILVYSANEQLFFKKNIFFALYSLFKPLFFALSPEKAHVWTMRLLDVATAFAPTRSVVKRLFCHRHPALERRVAGLQFLNPVGLAAGFDKDGRHIRSLACLGFGYIEVGTVTPLAQEGNPRPRLFRLPADRALINRMGFNNDGLEALAGRLRRLRQKGWPEGVVVGGNIGKNKNTANENAVEDYRRCLEVLHPWVDYFVVNVSSPNTPNLRALQDKEPLQHLLHTLQEANRRKDSPKPLFLKIAPDLSDAQLADIAAIVQETGITGVIATNTTSSRRPLSTPPEMVEACGAGGLSGAPLGRRSAEVLSRLRGLLGKGPVLIGVGGIDSPESAVERIEAGADLIQVYTGLIYEGPGLVRRILHRLSRTGTAHTA